LLTVSWARIMVKLTAAQTFKIVSYLLANPSTSQIKISRSVEVSRDLVNHVVQSLEGPGIVLQEKREHLELKEPLRLLEALSIERPLSRLVVEEIRTDQSEVSKVERMVRNWSVHSQRAGLYALTCFSALSKYTAYYISYPSVHVYSSDPEELSKGLVHGRGDIIVHVLRPDSDLIFRNTRLVKDLAIVEPIQVVVDLFCLGGAGRDGAMKLYQSLTEPNAKKPEEEFKSNQRRKRSKSSASSRKKLLRRIA
jgi:biotin operon repressor